MASTPQRYLLLLVPALAAACSTADTSAGETASSTGPLTSGQTSVGGSTSEADPSTTALPTSGGSDTGGGGETTTTGGTTDSGISSTSGLSATSGEDSTGDPLPAPFCGDGVVDPLEECDLGMMNADDGACTLGCKSAACGDGLVQTGTEACDDGNQDDTDNCLSTCELAACGDGKLGPGESCDDGNQIDNDACGNDCALASCGDGKPQPGEVCDDGNKVDTDACLQTCVAASCGDGFVQAGVEMCDDGNPDETDVCTTLCKAPACDDAIKSGKETDIDCGGGSCPTCTEGQACLSDTDCETGACVAGKCGIAQTCKQIKQALPASKDGVYTIDPDKDGPGTPFQVYCDMTVDGGGWTSLVHLTKLDRLNYSLPHTDVGVSESTRFWILASKPGVAYSEKDYGGLPFTNFEAEAAGPTTTGWKWNGVDYPNPAGCHVYQQLVLDPSVNAPPRSYGNPHFNAGASNPAALNPAALVTASTIDVAPVVNFPSIHVGCIGWNVLKDPIVWVR